MPRRLIDMAPEQRPRQRLAEVGSWALSDAELLAVLLSAGRCGRSVVQAAEEVLAETGGLVEMSELGVEELIPIRGFGKAKAATLVAAVELGRRMTKATLKDSPRLDGREAVGEFLVGLLQHEQRDVFGFLSLDSRYRLIGQRELRIEDRSNLPLDDLVAALLRQVILASAAGFVLFHHVVDADQDFGGIEIGLTQRLVRPCDDIGVPLLDTFVVGGGCWVSLRKKIPRLF